MKYSRLMFICMLPDNIQKKIEKACRAYYKRNKLPWNEDCLCGRIVDLEGAINLHKLGL